MFFSCSNFFDRKDANISITTSFSRSIEPQIQSATLKISGDDMDEISASTKEKFFEVLVPVGKQRTFYLEITLESGIKISGSTTSDITDEAEVKIVMKKIKVDLGNIDNDKISTEVTNLGLNGNIESPSITINEPLLLKLNDVSSLHHTIWFNSDGEVITQGTNELNFSDSFTEVGEYEITARVYYYNKIQEEKVTIIVSPSISYVNITLSINKNDPGSVTYDGPSVVKESETVVLTAYLDGSVGDNYIWYINGINQIGQSGSSLSIDGATLNIGDHSLTCVIIKGDNKSSIPFDFSVVADSE